MSTSKQVSDLIINDLTPLMIVIVHLLFLLYDDQVTMLIRDNVQIDE